MQNETIWVTGATGRLGSVLVKALGENENYTVYGTGSEVDITDLAVCVNKAEEIQPTVIINCAAISDAEYCRKHEVEAYKVNALGARNLAIASQKNDAMIIYISTDDVFTGEENESKNEFDVPAPKTTYGKSKYAGENFTKELNPKHLIIRSSWIYGSGAEDYFTYVVDKGKKGERFRAAINQLSTPTSIDVLVRFIIRMIDRPEFGIVHASCEGVCSRYEFAREILKKMGYNAALVDGVFAENSKEFVSSVLSNMMIKMTGCTVMPEWEEALEEYVSKYKSQQ